MSDAIAACLVEIRGVSPATCKVSICHRQPRHFSVKGRGPVSISNDLMAVSVKHRRLYMSTSIECHCCVQSFVVNLGVGKSVRCLDHFHIPVANVFCPLAMV